MECHLAIYLLGHYLPREPDEREPPPPLLIPPPREPPILEPELNDELRPDEP